MPAFGNVDGARVVVSGISSDVTQNVNVTQWFGSTAPTVGQKVAASSIPVVVASDQGPINTGVANWIGSTAPTVGQKASAFSLPVTLSTEQEALLTTLVARSSRPDATAYDPARADSGVILASAGTLWSIYAQSNDVADLYLLTFDATVVPANGTPPADFFLVPSGPAGEVVEFTIPRRYSAGIVWAASSTVDTLTLAGASLLVRARYTT